MVSPSNLINKEKITQKNYLNFKLCHRAFYYSFFDSDKCKKKDNQKQIEDFNLINNLICKHFNACDINQFYDENENISKAQITKQIIKKFNTIANAVFTYNNLKCSIDLLKKNENENFDLYKIKTSNNFKKHLKECCIETTFQKYVATKCDLKIENVYVIYLNPDYVRHGDIEILKLFIFQKLNNEQIFKEESEKMEKDIEMMNSIVNNRRIKNSNCNANCDFFDHCHANLPKPNVTDINGIKKNYAHQLIKDGIVTYEDIKKQKKIFNDPRKQIQIDNFLNKKTFSVHKELLKNFLKKINYPLYYLDFETMNEVIPPFDGTKVYEQIPFQYSIHIETKKGSKLTHKSFLGKKMNCIKELAENLVKDIPLNSCILVFNATTEKNIIKKLARQFPEISKHLENIADNIVDLLEPFKKGYYYHSLQGNSNSIKNILPALCPKMKDAYKKLENIHNGSEASNEFPKMINMLNNKDNQYKLIQKKLLEYCCLDTLGMNKILNVLYKSIEK